MEHLTQKSRSSLHGNSFLSTPMLCSGFDMISKAAPSIVLKFCAEKFCWLSTRRICALINSGGRNCSLSSESAMNFYRLVYYVSVGFSFYTGTGGELAISERTNAIDLSSNRSKLILK